MKHCIRMFVFVFVALFAGKAVAQLEAPLMIAQDDSIPIAGSRIVSLSESPARFHIGSFFDVFTELTLNFSSSPRFALPAPGAPETRVLTGTATFRLSLDGGVTFQSHQCQVDATVHVSSSSGGPGLSYDTEMLSLSLSGGTLPGGVMIRESPTLASTGKIYIRESPTLQRIGSFFDIFTEMSVDGGSTWSPADYTVKGYTVNARSDTPIGCDRASVSGVYGGDIEGDAAMDLVISTDLDTHSPPLLATQTTTMMCRLHLSQGGNTLSDPNAEITFRMTHTHDQGSTQFYDTEILSMKAKDSTGPIKVMIRESPSKASLGRVKLTYTPPSSGAITSFCNVFPELSTDGGTTWTPVDPVLLHFTAPHLTTMSLPSLQVVDLLLPVSGSVMVDPTNNPMEFRIGSFFDVFTEISLDFSSTSRFGRPAINTALNHPFTGEARFRSSLDGGSSFQVYTCPIDAMVQISHTMDADGDEVFDTEMLYLSLSGGTLPGGVMIRESPTKASLGRTSVRESPSKPTRIGSFFDVFTELSLDGGGTWTPAESPTRLECKSLLEAPSPSPSPFPTGRFKSSEVSVTPQVSNLKIFYPQSAPPGPPLGGSLSQPCDCDVTMQYNGDERLVSNPPSLVRVTHTFDDASGEHYDTEMLQLDLSGGTLPAGVMFRESPTLQSTGKTTVRQIPGTSLSQISSFFDVFTELSLDGGASWTPQPPTTIAYSDSIPAGGGSTASCEPGPVYANDLYPSGILAVGAEDAPQEYTNDVTMRSLVLRPSTLPAALPAAGSQLYNIDQDCDFQLSPGLGLPFQDRSATAHAQIQVTLSSDDGTIRTFDTEMLSLDISGGSLPGGVMLRESPTLASTGKHVVRTIEGGYTIDGFFDVFTEISLDGGATWAVKRTPVPIKEFVTLLALNVHPPTPYFPPQGVFNNTPQCADLVFSNGVVLRDISFFDVFTELAIPPPGGTSTGTITARGPRQSVSLDGSFSFHDEDCDVTMTIAMSSSTSSPTDRTFDTEMLSMNVVGHGGGGGGGSVGSIMLRESPTIRSTGKTYIRESPTLPTRTASFFDVFTEVSLDGGATWSPALKAMHFELDSIETGSISGTKWVDLNGDGVHDAGESGAPGWTIVLSDTNGTTIDSTVTGPAGEYSFTNVPVGIYRIFETPQPGWIQTGGAPAYGTWVVPGDVLTGFDFGNFKGSSLTGVKFNDKNGDGVRDPGEEGLKDWEICLVPKTSLPLGTEMNTVTATVSMHLDGLPGLPPGYPVSTTLIGFWASKKGYDYYKRGTFQFEKGDKPVEDLGLDLRSTSPVDVGGSLYDVSVSSGKIRRKGWDGLIYHKTAGSELSHAFFDVFTEITMTPHDDSTGLLRVFNWTGIFDEMADFEDDGSRTFVPGTVFSSGPTVMYNEVQVPDGVTDQLAITIGNPVSPSNPVCVQTDKNGVYVFDPVLPGTWNVLEHEQPCWDQTTPVPGPIVVVSNPSPDCVSPDNGTGTIDLPAQCDIKGGKMMMTNGLPSGTETASDVTLHSFGPVTRTPGGPLGGESAEYSATLTLDMQGSGDLAGFHRIMAVPVLTRDDFAPRSPGSPLQSFACDLRSLQGQITGDPDFDLLRITAGSSFGMPSPGHVTVLKSSGGGWSTSMWIDISCRIDFVGHPGGALGGMSGSTTGTIRISQGGESGISPVDFGNHESGGTIAVAKYHDINHNQQLDPGEPPMSGVQFILTDMTTLQEYSTPTDVNGLAYFSNLPKSDYDLTEVVPAGYTISVPKAGHSFFSVLACDTQSVMWMNAGALTDTMFRTATYEEWATAVDAKNGRKPVKCKPDKVDFKLNLVVPTLATSVSIVELKFSMPTTIHAVWADGKNKSVPYCYDTTKTTVDIKHQLYRFDLTDICAGSAPTPGQMIQFDGQGHKGSLIKVTYGWFTTVPGTKAVIKGSLPAKPVVIPGDEIKPILRLPMPNLVNVLQELQEQLVFPIVVGGVVGDTHSVYIKAYGDVLKSMAKAQRGGPYILHDSTNLGDCLDSLNGKLVKKQIKGLPPEKYQHRLFAEALTLKLNILASKYRKFPAGFDTLIYDYHKVQPGPFDGKSVAEILRQTEAFISCKGNPKPGATAQDYFFVLRRINEAFSGPIDTIRWSCLKLEMKGVRKLKDVIYMRADPGAFANYIEAPKEGTGMNALPSQYALMQNYPNPFNPTTNIEFELAEASLVTLKIYNTLGQEVATLLNGDWMEDGTQSIEFEAGNLPSGVYFYRILAQGVGDAEEGLIGQQFISVKKMILVK